MTAVVPGFTYRPIPGNHHAEHWDYSDGLILHVATGPADASLYGWFTNPSAQASSHWWVGASGGREQYLDPDEDVSWAQAGGNNQYHSVETGGNPEQALTDAQIDGVAAIYRWGHEHFGWPYQLAEAPGEKGLGWHGMGGAAWGGHYDCPGVLRKAQRQEILDRAQGITTQATTVAATEEEEDIMGPITFTDLDGQQKKTSAEEVLGWIVSNQNQHARVLNALASVVYGEGVDVVDEWGTPTGRKTNLATETMWNPANAQRAARSAGMSDDDVQKLAQKMAEQTVRVDVTVKGQQA